MKFYLTSPPHMAIYTLDLWIVGSHDPTVYSSTTVRVRVCVCDILSYLTSIIYIYYTHRSFPTVEYEYVRHVRSSLDESSLYSLMYCNIVQYITVYIDKLLPRIYRTLVRYMTQ